MASEFTFPIAAVPRGQCKLPAFPPPWFLTVANADNGGAPWDGERGEEEEEEQEKMDMLWEDFNEELTRTPPVCPLSPLIRKGGMTMMMKEAAWLDDDVDDGDEYGGAADTGRRGGRLNAGSVVRRRRWSLLLMLRLLKKLFLVKKSRNQRTVPI